MACDIHACLALRARPTALLGEATRGHAAAVGYLVTRVQLPLENEGRSALCAAAASGHGSVVRTLLALAARADVADAQGMHLPA